MSLLYDCTDPEDRADGLSAAAGAINRGDLVVMPTDTVYGVAADAFSVAGVDSLFRAKGRGRNMPSPVLVGSWGGLDGLVIVVDSVVRELVEAFWPGGLTIIVEHAPSLEWDLGETRGTVAVRMPAHPAAIDLLAETGPLAVSSANRTGQPAPKTAAEAREQLGDEVSVYLEAGPAEGTPSTIVDMTGEAPVLRRVGAVSAAALREIASNLVVPEELREAAGEPPEPVVVPVSDAPAGDESTQDSEPAEEKESDGTSAEDSVESEESVESVESVEAVAETEAETTPPEAGTAAVPEAETVAEAADEAVVEESQPMEKPADQQG